MRTLILYFSILVTVFSAHATSEKKISKQEYIDTWRQIAVRQMIDHNIPASITLAQGILESASGNSILAKKGNNHFGIKCHDWTGEKIFMDDDSKNECFRVYASGEESYIDHGQFLKTKSRYSKLFSYDPTDYKKWAVGLKEAGYATNPKYPELLIEIIESLGLSDLDKLGDAHIKPQKEWMVQQSTKSSATRTINLHENKVKYVVAKKGDTFYELAKELHLTLRQIRRYNDFDTQKEVLEEGDIIYIQPKRRKSKSDATIFQVKKSMTLREISQETAIKLESLSNMNDLLNADTKIDKGEKIRLK